jgi:hypothetical protein
MEVPDSRLWAPRRSGTHPSGGGGHVDDRLQTSLACAWRIARPWTPAPNRQSRQPCAAGDQGALGGSETRPGRQDSACSPLELGGNLLGGGGRGSAHGRHGDGEGGGRHGRRRNGLQRTCVRCHGRGERHHRRMRRGHGAVGEAMLLPSFDQV